MKCKYCGQPARHSCAWPVPGAAAIQARLLSAGMTIAGQARCDSAYLSTDRRFVYFTTGNGRQHTRRADETVYVEGMRPCGAACCDAHMREPGEGVAYCAEHWRLAD